MRDRAARTRTGLTAKPTGAPGMVDPRIHVTLPQLRALEGQARNLRFLPRQPAASVFNGRHASRLRGRGLNFEELRDYLPGDDPRTIDWKVTARTGKPHVRVYSEERDRPVLILVDQRMSMFFGTKYAMKSVTAAEMAALAAFRILDQGDRVGGIIFGDELTAEIKPKASRAARDRFLAAIARSNQMLRADAPAMETPMSMNVPLRTAARIARRNHLVIVISDFDSVDDETASLVGRIASTNDLILCPVTDPMSKDIPTDMKLIVSDGELQVELNTTSNKTHESLVDYASGRLAEILNWQKRYRLMVLPLSAGEDVIPQVRRLTGLSSTSRRQDP